MGGEREREPAPVFMDYGREIINECGLEIPERMKSAWNLCNHLLNFGSLTSERDKQLQLKRTKSGNKHIAMLENYILFR